MNVTLDTHAAITGLVTKADLRTDLAQLEQRLTLRIVTIVAIANGILFVALRSVPPAT